MDQDSFLECAPDYALGLLEGEDLEEFERHLTTGCEGCEVELARMDAVGDALAYAAPLVRAPQGLRARVLAAVDADLAGVAARASALDFDPSPAPLDARLEDPRTSPPPLRPAARPLAAAPREDPGVWVRVAPALALVGLIVAALSGFYAFTLHRKVGLMRADLERVQAENQELARVMDVVASPRLEMIALAGQPPAPTSEGRVLWSPDSRKAVFQAHGLPRSPAGRDYQLWVIAGSTPRSEGVFPVDEQGQATHVLPDLPDPGNVTAFGVTLEPAGGLPQPVGPIYLLGAVIRRAK